MTFIFPATGKEVRLELQQMRYILRHLGGKKKASLTFKG